MALYVPHVVERTRHLHRELGEALALADVAIVTDFVGQRDAPREGVSARMVLDAVPDPSAASGRRRSTTPSRLALRLVRPGDLVVTLGVGEPWRAARAIVDGLPDSVGKTLETMEIETGIPLSRLTTIGTGGPATALARPSSLAELEEARRLGGRARARRGDDRARVERPRGGRWRRRARPPARGRACGGRGRRATCSRAGGGATNAVCLHRARAAGLGGLEFACAIPGTAGGGVRMNAGAYGSDWAAILQRALVVVGAGSGWLDGRRARALVPALVARAGTGRRPGRVPADAAGRRHEIKAEVAELVARRKATQPTNKRTFGSVFKNPPGEVGAGRMLELCGLKGHRIGGAVISPRHANFIENADGATSADCLALMAEARRRAREEFGVALEQEVVLLGSLPKGLTPRAWQAESSLGGEAGLVVAERGRAGRERRSRARAASVVVPFPRTTPRRSPRARPARPVRAARC